MRTAITKNTKLIMLCSPNNPTANSFDETEMISLLEGYNGLLVVDEAYIDFSSHKGLVRFIATYPNLVILQTFSKAWGLAGLRLGIAYASEAIITILNKIKYPYNVNMMTQQLVLEALNNVTAKDNWVFDIINQRNKLEKKLGTLSLVEKIYPSDANFILLRVKDAKQTYDYLVDNQIIVRDRSKVMQCDQCLRITVGTATENDLLINALIAFDQQ